MGGYDKLKTEYLCWLMNRAHLDAEGPDGYLKLCETLQETEFVPQLEMDENRCEDCLDLRRAYALENGDEELEHRLIICLGWNGTMLELLVILAEKMRYEMLDSEYEAGTRKWILEMLANCGLDIYKNERMEEEHPEVSDILDRIIFRQTGWDGEGSFFPLAYPMRNQRYVELITQMNNYLEENYDIC